MQWIGDKKFYQNVSKIAVPIIIQNAFTFMVGFVDNVMVGQIGTEAMSGVAIVNQLVFVFNVCILGIIAGASIFGAQFYGNHDYEGLQETFRFRVAACTILSAAAILLFWAVGGNLISLFLYSENSSSEIILSQAYGESYLYILLLGFLPSALTQVYASTLKDMGKTVLPMSASVTAVLLNTLLNYILIFGKFGFPRLGVEGAAIATILSRFAECAVIAVGTHVQKSKYPFISGAYKKLRISPDLAKKILIKGSPLMVNEFFWSIGTVLMVQCYSFRGIEVVAGMNIATTVYNMFSLIYIAIGTSIAMIIGQLLGAGKMEEARDTDNKLIFLAVASSVLIGVLIGITAPVFPKLYHTTEKVRGLATAFMYILAVCMPIAAFIHAAFFTIRAGGKTLITFLFDSLNLWLVNIPLAFCLTRFTDLSIVTIYFICQMADLIKCSVGFILVKKGIWLNNIVNTNVSEQKV